MARHRIRGIEFKRQVTPAFISGEAWTNWRDAAIRCMTQFGSERHRLRRGPERPLPAIDPGTAASPHPSVTLLREPSQTLLPAECERIGTR